MTLPNERTNAVLNTKMLLLDLMDPKKTPRVPMAIRKRARSLLKHYPNTFDFYMLFKGDKQVFGETDETADLD